MPRNQHWTHLFYSRKYFYISVKSNGSDPNLLARFQGIECGHFRARHLDFLDEPQVPWRPNSHGAIEPGSEDGATSCNEFQSGAAGPVGCGFQVIRLQFAQIVEFEEPVRVARCQQMRRKCQGRHGAFVRPVNRPNRFTEPTVPNPDNPIGRAASAVKGPVGMPSPGRHPAQVAFLHLNLAGSLGVPQSPQRIRRSGSEESVGRVPIEGFDGVARGQSQISFIIVRAPETDFTAGRPNQQDITIIGTHGSDSIPCTINQYRSIIGARMICHVIFHQSTRPITRKQVPVRGESASSQWSPIWIHP